MKAKRQSKAAKNRKATQAVMALRVEDVLRIRLDGAEIWDLREYVREKEKEDGSPWLLKRGETPLSDSSLWRYIRLADDQLREGIRAGRKSLLRSHIGKRRNLYARCVQTADYRTALSVLDSEAKLMGLNELELLVRLEKLEKAQAELEQRERSAKAETGSGRGEDREPDPDACDASEFRSRHLNGVSG